MSVITYHKLAVGVELIAPTAGATAHLIVREIYSENGELLARTAMARAANEVRADELITALGGAS